MSILDIARKRDLEDLKLLFRIPCRETSRGKYKWLRDMEDNILTHLEGEHGRETS